MSIAPLFALRGHGSPVACVGFVGDPVVCRVDGDLTAFEPGCHLASGDWNGVIRLWDLCARRSRATIEAHGANGVLALERRAHDPSTFVSQGRDGWVKLWDRRRADRCSAQVQTGSYNFCRMAIRDDVVAVPGHDAATIGLWDLRTGEPSSSFPISTTGPKEGMCTSLQFLPDGLLLAGTEGGSVQVWDLRAAGPARPLQTTKLHDDPAFALAFNAPLMAGVSGSASDQLRPFQVDVEQRSTIVRPAVTLEGKGCSRIASRSDGAVFGVCSWERAVYLYSWRTLRHLATLSWHRQSVFDVAFADPASGCTATASKDGQVTVYRVVVARSPRRQQQQRERSA